MARPPILPTWATNANYPAGVLDWSGQPTRVQPPGGTAVNGFTPNTDVPAEYLNWLVGVLCDWTTYLDSEAATQGLFGDASDGVVTATTGSLARDMYYDSLTVPAGVSLCPNSYRIFVRNTLTIANTGSIQMNGASASVATGGSGYNDQTLRGSSSGGSGTNTNATAVSSFTNSLGGSGGNGGEGSGSTTHAGGTTTPPASNKGSINNYNSMTAGAIVGSASGLTSIYPGVGGGGGGGNGASGVGGGGGAGGGMIMICARNIVLTGSAAISAVGGAGANSNGSQASSAGGGGGGGGGVILLVYGNLNSGVGVPSSFCTVAGGTPGISGASASMTIVPMAGTVGSLIALKM